MIIKEFTIEELNLHFFVGINQIKISLDQIVGLNEIENNEQTLNQFFKIIEGIQNKHKHSLIQFIKEKYILNDDHIFMACYNLQKAFQQKINISNKKNIELLLYLAANRQISRSIEAFGINFSDLKNTNFIYCIISPINNLNKINDDIIKSLNGIDIQLTINNQSLTKFNIIKDFFEISEDQINTILKSYGIETIKVGFKLKSKFSALNDLICEKMALLSLENVKIK